MAINIEVRDYNTARGLKELNSCAYGNIHYTGRNDTFNIRDQDNDGDAYLRVNDFMWWVGCQHAIKLTWPSGEEVILKPDRNVKIKKDKAAQMKILDYFKLLAKNEFKYTPFGEPELKLELAGTETEFMDI